MAADGHVILDTSLDASGFEKGVTGLKNVASKGLAVTAKTIAAVGSGLSGLAAAAVKVGASFESQMSTVESLSNASTSTVTTASGDIIDGFTAISDKAKEIGATTSLSATEAAQGLEYMALAGWDAQEMYDGLSGVANLAAASGEDLAVVSDILTDAITAFGDEASDAERYADVLAKTSAATNTTVSMLGESFKYTAATAGTYGFSLEDVSAALGLMANAGIKGSQSGTALNAILTRLGTNTSGARDAIEELGVSFYDSEGNARPLKDIMIELCDATADMTDEQKANFANTVAGMEAQKGLLAILNQGSDAYRAMTETLYGCAGAASEMAAIRLDNFEGQIKLLESAAESLGIAVYEELQVPLRDLAYQGCEYVAQLYNAFESGGFDGLVSELGTVLANAVVLIAGYIPQLASAAISLIASFVQGMASAAPEIAQEALILISQLVQSLVMALPQLAETGGEAVHSFAVGIGNFLGDLIGYGAQLIPALIEGLAQGFELLTDAAVTILEYLVSSLQANLPILIPAGLEAIASLISSIAEALPQLLNVGASILATLAEGIRGAFDSMGSVSSETIMRFIEGLEESFTNLVTSAADIIYALADGIREHLPELLPVALEAIASLSGSLRENVGQIVDAGLALIVALAQSLIDSLPALIENIPIIVENIAGCINDNAPKLIETALYLITQLAIGLVKAIPTLIANLPQIIQAIIDAFLAFNWINLGKSIINLIRDGFTSLSQALPKKLEEIGKQAFEKLKNIDWKGVGSSIIQFIDGGLNAFVRSIPSTLKSIGSTALEWIQGIDWISGGRTIIQKIVSGVQALFSHIPDALRSVGNSAFEAFGNIKWGDLGRAIISGIVTGIGNMASYLFDSLRNLASNALNAAKNALGINSPSRKFRDIVGKAIPEGIVKGIEASENLAIDAVHSLSDSMIDEARDIEIDAPHINFDDDQDGDKSDPLPFDVGDDPDPIIIPVKFDYPDFDFPDDITGIVGNMRLAVDNTVNDMGSSMTSMSGSLSRHNTTSVDSSNSKPEYVETTINLEGKSMAKAITPYISKQLAWEGKR